METKHYRAKRTFTRDMKSHFRSVVFFSLVPLATASIVDDSYTSYEDLYDAILNTFFPITFVLLINVDRNSGTIKKKLLPLLDDVLYNAVTWAIPLTASFAYNDFKAVKNIFNCKHVFTYNLCTVCINQMADSW